jgi:hypothetical protein
VDDVAPALAAPDAPADARAADPANLGSTTTWNVLTAKAALPTDSLTLVAGPYVTASRTVEGVTLSTFFYEQDAALQDLWLAAGEAIVKRYAAILGPYPHPKFDIVANFFSTGYGMPSFTLLGDEVIRSASARAQAMGGAIPAGYLDHEYVHGWYGNGLFVDYATGNWCEGLTTYCSNYLAKELEGPEAARAQRRGTLEKWSLRVKGAKDTPVRAFLQKVEDTDNDIGYGKASMIFHLVRRQLGDEAFWSAVKRFTQARVGTLVAWDDWLALFDEAAGSSVSARVKPYLERAGLPGAEIVSVERAEKDGSHQLKVRVRQTPATDGGGPWPLVVTLRAEGLSPEAGEEEVDLSSGETELTLVTDRPATAVVLDPDYHALRRIAEADLPPCLERTLLGEGGVVVLAGGAQAVFQPLAEQIAAARGWRVVGPEFDLAGFAGPALVLGVAPEGARRFEAGGKVYEDPGSALLTSSVTAGRLRTVFTALSEAAASRAQRLPFYAWDPWVVFAGGRPVARDARQAEPLSTRASWSVAWDEAAPEGAEARVKADLEKLCSKELEGRWPGSKGHDLARDLLKERVKAWSGQDAWLWEFGVGRWERASSRDLTLVYEDRQEVLKDAFRPFVPGEERLIAAPEYFEMVEWSNPSIFDLAIDANKRTTSLVVYVLTPEAEVGLSPYLDSTGDLTATAKAELEKPGRDGKPRAKPVLAPWLCGRRARIAPHLTSIPRAIVAVDAATGAKLAEAWEKDARIAMEVRWNVPARCADVAGSPAPLAQPREMMDPRPRPPVVVLCAHYDSFGQQGEKLWVGADDNASGVACLLEVLANLPADAAKGTEAAPGVVVLFTDAEEWGLRGARHAAQQLKDRYDVRAVINVDSVGRAATKPTHIIGLSTHPALAGKLRGALEAAGIAVGKDIDEFAYPHGSDHMPFHDLEIPAITLWASDYAVMNTAADTLDKVEVQGVVKLAHALAKLLREDLAGVANAGR